MAVLKASLAGTMGSVAFDGWLCPELNEHFVGYIYHHVSEEFALNVHVISLVCSSGVLHIVTFIDLMLCRGANCRDSC